MKIIIVGAGIGGLTAALCLAEDGHQVTVLEQADRFAEIGAGLQCGANAVHVLTSLGLESQLDQAGVLPQAVEFRDFKLGEELYRIELGQSYRQRFGAPYYHIHRADLLDALLSQVRKHKQIDILCGQPVDSVNEKQESAQVMLQNGSVIDAELVVGCDGINSRVRAFISPHAGARFTGNTAWRALVPVARLPDDFMSTVVTNFVGSKKHIVMYYVRKQQLLNIVGVVENKAIQETSWTASAPWHELKSDYAGWHPMVQTAIDALEGQVCYRWALYDQAPMKNWSSNRVTLLGDAAHATLPFMASGAAMAIEDARILQRALQLDYPLALRLQIYQKNRLSRTSRIQNTSRKFGTLYHIPNRMLLKAAFKSLGVFAGKKEDFLPEYNANNVPLDTCL